MNMNIATDMVHKELCGRYYAQHGREEGLYASKRLLPLAKEILAEIVASDDLHLDIAAISGKYVKPRL